MRLLLNGAVRHAARNRSRDRRIRPRHARQGTRDAVRADQSDGPGRAAEPIVAGHHLLVEGAHRGRGPGIAIVRDRHVPRYHARRDRGLAVDRVNVQRMTGCTHIGSDSIAVDFADRRRGIRVGAVRVVVPGTREGGCGRDRRVHVLGLRRHERDLVAELAVLRVEQRIRGAASARVVHARDHHRGRIPGRIGRVDFPGRVSQAVEGAPVIGIHAGDLGSGPILDGYRQVGRREFLTECRRERIEFRGEVVGDDAGVVGGGVSRGEDPELRQRGGLVIQCHELPVAQIAQRSGERRDFFRLREQADVVGNNARLTHAGPEGLDAAGVALVAR